jgi:hypothetical protein
MTPFAQEHLGRGMSATGGHRADLRSELLERSSGLLHQRLTQDFAMLGLGRTPVLRCALFQPGDDLFVDVTGDQLRYRTLTIAKISSLSMPN